MKIVNRNYNYLHAPTYLVQRVASVELRRLARPRAVERVTHREGLHLETDHAPADKELSRASVNGHMVDGDREERGRKKVVKSLGPKNNLCKTTFNTVAQVSVIFFLESEKSQHCMI